MVELSKACFFHIIPAPQKPKFLAAQRNEAEFVFILILTQQIRNFQQRGDAVPFLFAPGALDASGFQPASRFACVS